MKSLYCTLLMFLLVTHSAAAAVIHVPNDHPTIQAGIDAAGEYDDVLVADGVWTGEGNRDLDFGGKTIRVGSLNGPQNCIIDCAGGRGFHFHSGEGPNAIVRGFTIRNGAAHGEPNRGGGGILIDGASPQINGCVFTNNFAPVGGGCSVRGGSGGLIVNCVFRDNTAGDGGGLALYGNLEVRNCLVTQNEAYNNGGGITSWGGGTVLFRGCTITENRCTDYGGGICTWNSDYTMENCIVWGNTADLTYPLPSDEGYLGGDGPSAVFRSSYCCFGDVWYNDGCTIESGPGIIGDDPLFTTGPEGDWYLSQVAAGQAVDSPCVDTGDPAWAPVGTTRTDHEPDSGVRDMGYHYPPQIPRTRLLAAPGPGYDNQPLVRIFVMHPEIFLEYEIEAYGPAHYGANVTGGDVDGDGVDDVLTGAGPGEIYGPHVRGFDRAGSELPGLSFLAYGTNKYGVNVVAGDLDGDGTDEIITGAGPGAVFGPHVRAWIYDGASGVTPYPGVSYFAYGTPKWGVNVATGDIDGDGYDEIVTGAGPGAVYGPHVRGWDVDGNPAVTAMPGVSFLAYGTHKYGVNVTCGDMDGDGIDEIVTGAGPGAVFGPHVRGWNFDGSTVSLLPFYSFFAWESSEIKYGVNVAAMPDLDLDGREDLAAGRGPDPNADTMIRTFTYTGTRVNSWLSVDSFPGYTHGANVAAGSF